jgi:hypothetical protein
MSVAQVDEVLKLAKQLAVADSADSKTEIKAALTKWRTSVRPDGPPQGETSAEMCRSAEMC